VGAELIMVEGGRAGTNSVTYYSSEYRVTAYRGSNKEITVKVSSKKKSKLQFVMNRLYYIPFIRGIWLFLEGLFLARKLYLPSLALLFLLDKMQAKPTKFIDNNNWNAYLFIVGTLLICSLFIKVSQIGKYHSAEHMVDNAFENTKILTVSNALKFPRVHHRCGTNLMIFILITYFLLSLVLKNSFLEILLAGIFGYELFAIKNKRLISFLKPIYFIGYTCQRFLFTSKPKNEHIEVAIAAYKELLRSHEKID
jgi:uncharacterized protein YqhQ